MKILFNNFNTAAVYPKSKVNFGNSYAQNPIHFCAQKDNFELNQSEKKESYEEQLYRESFGDTEFEEITKELLLEEIAAAVFIDYFEYGLEVIGEDVLDDKEKALGVNNVIFEDSKISPKNAAKIQEILNKGKIDTIRKLKNAVSYFRQLNKSKKFHPAQGMSFLRLYCTLDNPKDISSFPQALNCVDEYNRNHEDEIDVNEFVRNARAAGIKNENDLDTKFAYLAPNFNNFEDSSDKASAIEYIVDTYPIKIAAISLNMLLFSDESSYDAKEFYKKYYDLVDYLYEHNKKNFSRALCGIMSFLEGQNTNLQPHATEAVKGFVDIKSPEGKIELFQMLKEEDISISELNELTKTKHISDIDLCEVIFSKREIISELAQITQDSYTCEALYSNFAQTLAAIYGNDNDNNSNLMADFFFSCALFDIKNDKEFINFFLNVARPETKASKKKGQTQNKKVTQQDVINFISLLEFADGKMIQKYKNNKNYPLYLDLTRREAQYNKIKKPLEEQFKKQGYKHFIPNSKSLFINYYNLYEKNPNVEAFANSIIEAKEIQTREEQIFGGSYRQFLEYFEDEKALEEFLYKNDIDTKDDKNGRAELYLKILHALLDDRNDEEKQKLLKKFLNSKFFENSNKHLASIVSSKSEEEIRVLFEIILSENITSKGELKTIFKPYTGKNKELDSFLSHFKASGMDFKSYIEKISQIQKKLATSGLEITINNDNIRAIKQEDLKEGKLTLKRMTEIAKEILNPDQEGNFICGYDNALIEKDLRYNMGTIAREIILSQNGRYEGSYEQIISQFKLDPKSLDTRNVSDDNYKTRLYNKISSEDELVNLINSQEWLNIFDGDKKPNLSLHAKMRLIERFILDTQDKDSLSQKQTIKKLKDILTTIYTQTPKRIKAGNDKSSLVAFFDHDGYEIKAVFAKDGQLLTVAKNEL